MHRRSLQYVFTTKKKTHFFTAAAPPEVNAGILTVVAVVVHQDDFLEQVRRRVIDSRVDRAQNHRQSLVDEDEDEGDLREVSGVADLPASAEQRETQLQKTSLNLYSPWRQMNARSMFLNTQTVFFLIKD